MLLAMDNPKQEGQLVCKSDSCHGVSSAGTLQPAQAHGQR